MGGSEIWKALAVTAVLWILNFIPQLLLSLVLAAWFTDVKYKLKGTGAYKVIMYMPNIITAATIAVLFYAMFETNGPITQLLRNMGWVGKEGLLMTGWASLLIIAFIQFWMWYGNTMIVLCAGILGINPSLYEAAMVDGANSKQQFFKITLPLLKPILQYTMVTSAIGGLQMFDIPYLFNSGGPIVQVGDSAVNSTTTVMMLIRNYVATGNNQNMGRAASYSIVLFVVTMVVSLIFYKLTSDKQNDGR
jgi:multiple sugar transport system permease protein